MTCDRASDAESDTLPEPWIDMVDDQPMREQESASLLPDNRSAPVVFVSWAPQASRSTEIARALDAACYFIHVLGFRRPFLAPLKYPLQWLKTWKLLWSERPGTVIVQNPPLPALFCVALYAWMHRAQFIIDTHTAALVDRKWAWSVPLQRRLGRHALATILHTPSLLPRLAGSGRVLVVEDPPPALASRSARFTPLEDGPARVVVAGSFGSDEPIEELLHAAARLSDVQFYLTGSSRQAARPKALRSLPPNVHLTGWLEFEEYIALLRSANVIVSLTSRDFTLLRGAWEAVYLGKPLVTSDWPAPRQQFVQGTVFVERSGASIAAGIRAALHREETLSEEMLLLGATMDRRWMSSLATLRHLIARNQPAPPTQ